MFFSKRIVRTNKVNAKRILFGMIELALIRFQLPKTQTTTVNAYIDKSNRIIKRSFYYKSECASSFYSYACLLKTIPTNTQKVWMREEKERERIMKHYILTLFCCEVAMFGFYSMKKMKSWWEMIKLEFIVVRVSSSFSNCESKDEKEEMDGQR